MTPAQKRRAYWEGTAIAFASPVALLLIVFIVLYLTR